MKHYTFHYELPVDSVDGYFSFKIPVMPRPVLKMFRVTAFVDEVAGQRSIGHISFIDYLTSEPIGEVFSLVQPPGPFTQEENKGFPVCDNNSPWYGEQYLMPGRTLRVFTYLLPGIGAVPTSPYTPHLYVSIALDDSF